MNGFSYHGWLATETPPPVAVADKADRMRAGRPIIIRRYRPPQRRVYTQNLIIAPGHELPIDRRFRLSIHIHGQPQRIVCQRSGESLIMIPESLVPTVTEAVVAPVLPVVTERDELLRLFDRQHFQ